MVHVGYFVVIKKNTQELSGTMSVVITVVTIAAGIILFITYFLLLTKKFITYIKEISEGINQISLGNLENRIEIKNEDEFAFLADKLNQMADDIKEIMENERRSEYAKNELITSVAHDLRTPLTSIIGYLDLVSSKELAQDTQMKYIGIAYNKSKRLEKLIEDLFTYTKFNFGEVKANYTEVDIVKLLNQLVDEFYPSFSECHLEYKFITTNPAAVIKVDGDLLARAFANLISNAIKYGKDGKNILINLNKEDSKVVITITNFGEIIPKEDLERIFQRFYRVESSRSSETGGSGLGLAIAQSIIEMHGGRISAKSDTDGTVFIVELKNEPYKTS
ncbi:MAG: integral rane sensor signal transduction histidine kinase [Herbinix sp.]|nr:integral rane sensor signal transduction histidine kinase [Herbinix sp.]